jgi:CheY-like chemotaxis protein
VGVISEPGNGSTFWFIVNLRLDERDPWDDGSDDDEDSDGEQTLSHRPDPDTGLAGFAREPAAFAVAAEKPAPVQSEAKSTKPVRTIGKQTMNILLVEDNPTNAQLVQDMLELEGFTVYHAGNGQEALDALWSSRLPVEVVLMDCRMPVMDGYECTQRIRAHEAENPDAGHLPIIALTANVFEDDRNRCIQVGMDDFLRKPVDLAELVKTLRKHAG